MPELIAETPSRFESSLEVEFIIDALKLKKGMRVLDLACGGGRHLSWLEWEGIEAVGLDRSWRRLRAARKEAPGSQLVRADMRSLPFKDESFDAVINMFTSFGYFGDEGDLGVLEEISRVLRPGGKVLIEHWNPFSAARMDGLRTWWWKDEGVVVLAEAKFRFDKGVLVEKRMTIDLRRGRVSRSKLRIRFYFPSEMSAMFGRAGLRVRRFFGDFDGSDLTPESVRMITVGEKAC
ncbi:hypothetical protein DRP77_01505 [Candidatus Poribacteria bacterium]|nr:MAG: hypothetical protein DRP77_01505 [Candidatus Poribacteria bacterium]